ncbi:transposase [Deinococcus sp. Arct2-2]|nr:transposase [Deinococcus sp. Arct2-2]
MRTKCGSNSGDRRFEAREDFAKRGARGDDGGKKVNGRTHHLIVDTQGLLLGVKVLPANITGREESQQLLQELHQNQPQMKLHLFADGGDKGKWEGWVKTTLGYTVETCSTLRCQYPGVLAPRGAGTDRGTDQDLSGSPRLCGDQEALGGRTELRLVVLQPST